MATEWIYSFAPIENRQAGLLILGSMPGEASLQAGQYYAHPRNAFWPILGACLHFDAALPYPQRIRAMKASGIALWDVLHSCRRRGSLDAAIDPQSQAVNDFEGFFQTHLRIRAVLFNGTTAETCFQRCVPKAWLPPNLIMRRLPSTSPAMASLTLAQKTEVWGRTITSLIGNSG